jgi:serine/threonine-protein phosphatase PP1 catalytic subunit
VADALSRQQLNALDEQEPESCAATIHSELSLTHTIESTDKPLNCFQNQIVLEEARLPSKQTFILFRNKRRHVVNFACRESLLHELTDIIVPTSVNAFHCDLHTLAMMQDAVVRRFPDTKFWFCKNRVVDIFRIEEGKEILAVEHNRAHRAAQENVKQVLSENYFPKMAKLAGEIVQNCKTCARAKYDRHPKKQEIGETPIPSNTGEMLHIDIFSTDRKFFLTCVDKFSKFAVVQPINSRTIEDLKPALLLLMNFFPSARMIYCDNEPSLNSHTVTAMLSNNFGVSIANAPPLHSTSNGQVERFHSTLLELARCLKIDKDISDTVEVILLATAQYNKSIHSVVNRRPADIVQTHPNESQEEIRNRILKAQTALRARENATRQNRSFDVGEKVLVKSNRRLGNKLTPLCEERAVEADMGTTVLIKGRVVHKDNLR